MSSLCATKELEGHRRGGPMASLKSKIKTILEPIRAVKRSREGKKVIQHLIHNGVPGILKTPLDFLVTSNLNPDDKAVVSRVEEIRANLAARGDEKIPVYYSPLPGSAGTINNPAKRCQPGETKYFTAEWIANKTSTDNFWGTFKYLCSNYSGAKNILELGACAGISGCFMASGKQCRRFITIEASEPLANIARSTIGQITENYQVYNCLFDEGLDMILPCLEEKINMVLIDGHHEKVATIHYFKRLVPYLEAGCLVLFDDIYWSSDMLEAWEILRHWKGFSHTIDVGGTGLCIWSGNSKTVPKLWNLNKYTGNWKPSHPHGWRK